MLKNLIKMIIKNKQFVILFLTLSAFFLSSCLTVEKKEYTYELTGANSGKLTIKYVNIHSIMDNGEDVSINDFKELIDKYMNGDQINQDFPLAENIKKRLFEENGQLCGEVTMDFNDLSAARLYQYEPRCPIMMNISSAYDSETYMSSNGTYGNDYMPVVFWPANLKKLSVSTSVSALDENSVSLIDAYRIWLTTRH